MCVVGFVISSSYNTTHITLCNIQLSSFSIQQQNACTICLNVQQELTTYSSTFSVMFVCICTQVTVMRHSFVIRPCRTVACIKIDSTKEEVCVRFCICEKIYQMPVYCKALRVHSITNEQLKKRKNSKTKIRFFFVKKMMKMKYFPLIHTLFNAVNSNLYCVFYENHTFTSLSELWCVCMYVLYI